MAKTTSTTIYVRDGSNLTYIFLNQPTNNYINWIRFKDPKHPTQGKIEGIEAVAGPISAYLYDDNSIRLFFTGKPKAAAFASFHTIHEVKLPDANKETTDVSKGWQNASVAKELTFQTEVEESQRLSDPESFLSLTCSKDTDGHFYPAAVWKVPGAQAFEYGARKQDGTWDQTKFKLPS